MVRLGLPQFKIWWSTPLPYPPLFASHDASQIWVIRSRPPVGSAGFGSKSSGMDISRILLELVTAADEPTFPRWTVDPPRLVNRHFPDRSAFGAFGQYVRPRM